MFALNRNINETDTAILKLQQQNKLMIPMVVNHKGTITGNVTFAGTPFHGLINAGDEVVYSTYKGNEQLDKNLHLLAHSGTVKISLCRRLRLKPIPHWVSSRDCHRCIFILSGVADT